MISLIRCKCLAGFLWTSAIAAGIVTFAMFTLFDPVDLMPVIQPEADPLYFRLKAYGFGFLFFWVTFLTSTYLSCYYNQLDSQARKDNHS